MSEWASFETSVASGPLHVYRTGGSNKPPVLLVHGFADSGLCWTTVAQHLEPTFDVIMYDARGHGLSPLPESGLDREAMIEDLAQLIEALGLDRPAMMGHSMGAGTVSGFAAKYSEQTRGIVLEDPGWRDGSQSGANKSYTDQLRQETVAMKALSRDEIIAARRKKRPNWPVAECEAWADARINLDMRIYDRVGGLGQDWRETASAITCPTLLIHSDPALGGIVTAEVAREAVSLMAHCSSVHIAGAGHGIRREQLDRFVATVKPFLAQLYGA